LHRKSADEWEAREIMSKTASNDDNGQSLPNDHGLFRALFEQAAVGLACTDTATGRYLRVNQRYADIVGYSREELERIDFQTLTHPDDLPADLENMRRLVGGEIREFTMEKRFLRKGGAVVWVRLTVSALCSPGETPRFHVAVVEDISQHKAVEEALRSSEAKFNRAFRSSPDAVLITSLEDGRIREVNDAFVRMTGYQPEEVVGKTTTELGFWTGAEDRAAHLAALRARGHVAGQEFRFRIKSGEVRTGLLSAETVVINGEACSLSVTRDITERRQAEETLRHSRAELEEAQAVGHVGSWISVPGLNGRLVWSKETLRIFGLTDAEFDGRVETFWSLVHPEDRAAVEAASAAARAGERSYAVDHRIVRRDGTVRWVYQRAQVERDAAGSPIRMVGVTQDITERKQAEQALKESEERLRTVIETEPECVKVVDRQGRLLEMNAAGLAMLEAGSLEEVQREGLAHFILPDYRAGFQALHQSVMGGESGMLEFETTGLKGTRRWLETHAAPLRDASGTVTALLGVTRDVTDRKRAEAEQERLQAQLTQAQKMESVGRLAGGVAHDFNNMLQAILGNAAVALGQLPPGSPLRESLEEIEQSAQRSADLTRQLLAFARKQTIQPKVLDLNDTVAGMLKMLRRLIGEDIELTWKPGAALWPVRVDPSQIDQVLANLCVNARDAIADTGSVTIETRNVTVDETFRKRHPDATLEEYVMLTVSDTGHGIDAGTRSHLFEPFFTTKALGKGTGLGLATVFGIVKQNAGLIDVTSEPDRGATFRIFLPRTPPHVAAAEVEKARPLERGTETVLLVEDEVAVLNLGRLILEQQGYKVLAAATPKAAETQALHHQGPIHLLITDVVMPGMNGKALRDRLQPLHPRMKCLFISGYTADLLAPHGILDQDVHFLQKPFSNRSLVEKTREILDQK
jgi:two-component system, cell cycle sensor histidine kinase and response regulator CckA